MPILNRTLPINHDSDLDKSVVVLRTYLPRDHFTKAVIVPEIHLQDWLAVQPAENQ